MTSTAAEHPLTALPLSALIETRHEILKRPPASVIGGVALPGLRTGPKRGQGLEFFDLRQYAEGDDVRHIDWNVTARSDQPYTRLYREEKENSTTVVLDFRPHMYTGSIMLRSVRAGLQAARMLWQASAAGDRVASIVVSGHGIAETRPAAGRKGVLVACELIARQFAKDHRQQSSPTLDHLLARLAGSARQSGSYLVFSGFDNLGHTWQSRLDVLGTAGRTTGIMTLDPLEFNRLPTGRYRFQNNRQQGTTATIDQNSQRNLNTLLNDRIEQVCQCFGASGVPLVLDYADAPGEDTLLALLQGRA